MARIDAGDGAKACVFTASSGGTRQGPYVYRIGRPIVTLRWSIPRAAANGRWTISARCAKSKKGAKKARALAIKVAITGGKRKGPRQFIQRGSLRISTGARTAILGSPSPIAGETPEGGKGNGCASPDNGYKSVIDATSYCTGYCTWYAYSRRPAANLKHLGHARDWLPAARGRGIPTGSTPRPGAIAWWDGRVGWGYGHVAYVERVEGNTVVIAEMNVAGWNKVSPRSIPLNSPVAPHGYIYGADTPPPPPPPPPLPSGPQGGTQVVYGLGSTGASRTSTTSPESPARSGRRRC